MAWEMYRATLDPKNIYLATRSSFHQIFTDEHLNDVRNVSCSLRGCYSSDVSHAD